jgi:hypothetical protein
MQVNTYCRFSIIIHALLTLEVILDQLLEQMGPDELKITAEINPERLCIEHHYPDHRKTATLGELQLKRNLSDTEAKEVIRNEILLLLRFRKTLRTYCCSEERPYGTMYVKNILMFDQEHG